MVAAGRNVLTFVAALFALAGCRQILGLDEGVVGDGGTDGEPLAQDALAGPYRKRIVITSPVPSNLDGYVVPILRDSDADLAAHARADGSDLHFTQDGQMLPFEIVRFDALTGQLEAWVRLPTLRSSNRIDLQYGGEPIEHAAAQTWSNAVGVWHLTRGPASAFPDSSSFGHTAKSPTAIGPTEVDGVVGSAVSFSFDRRLDVGDPDDLDVGAGSFSVSLWVRVSLGGGLDIPLYKGGSRPDDPGYAFALESAGWSMFVSDGANLASSNIGPGSGFVGRWVHIGGVVDRSMARMTVYADGASTSVENIDGLGSLDSPSRLTFSQEQFPFSGSLDEVRIFRDAKPAAWFAAEHAFISPSSSLVEFSDEEAGD